MISELGSVIDFVPPPLFQEIIMALREYLSIVNFASAKWCDNVHLLSYYAAAHGSPVDSSLGIDTFHYKWRLQVVIIPLVMLSVPCTL